MIRLFKHYVPTPMLLLGLVDAVLLFASAEAAWRLRAAQAGLDVSPLIDRFGAPVTFTLIMLLTGLAVGVYQAAGLRAWRMMATRTLVAMIVGLVPLSVVFYLIPDLALWRSIMISAIVISFLSLMLFRASLAPFVRWDRFRRRIVVLGAGPRAAKLHAIAQTPGASFQVLRYVKMTAAEAVVPDAMRREDADSLREVVELYGAEEVVLAMEERRGSLPVAELLKVKLAGYPVCEMSSFLERETGRVDLGSVSPSWLIFSDGFLGAQQGALALKRLIDIAASALLLVVASPVLAVTAAAIKATSRGSVFYRQERVGRFGQNFAVVKFRSMREDAESDGKPQWAQEGDPRVTLVGSVIRALRIDEIPQIINVLRGDMSFVGPRPERPFFVHELAAQIPFYNERHVVKPGITGWAQLNYPYGASVDDARHKLEYDLYYIKNYSPFLDLLILIQTVRVILWRDGAR